ncbi:MAG: hypothetical protein R3C45_22175 [Phycisphaerales bacterium]
MLQRIARVTRSTRGRATRRGLRQAGEVNEIDTEFDQLASDHESFTLLTEAIGKLNEIADNRADHILGFRSPTEEQDDAA